MNRKNALIVSIQSLRGKRHKWRDCRLQRGYQKRASKSPEQLPTDALKAYREGSETFPNIKPQHVAKCGMVSYMRTVTGWKG
jgi:hypothetical protein